MGRCGDPLAGAAEKQFRYVLRNKPKVSIPGTLYKPLSMIMVRPGFAANGTGVLLKVDGITKKDEEKPQNSSLESGENCVFLQFCYPVYMLVNEKSRRGQFLGIFFYYDVGSFTHRK